ncbi:unnamed protein product [Agarophyton chilense]|eukprot:gb/GEZJ01001728.1/.p1 GENE.gb/GEZJ01001728.1/~~gb/GEZJ01001728.1/.p1  ORF type:complete len:911 (-),score=94.94 gb/GEZJ01001728.1/:1291-4023(-)
MDQTSLKMNDSDATTIPPEPVHREQLFGTRCKTNDHTIHRDERVCSGPYTHAHPPTVPNNAVVEDSFASKRAFTPIISSLTSGANVQQSCLGITCTRALHPATPHQLHGSLKSHLDSTRRVSRLPNGRLQCNAASLSTPLLKIGTGRSPAGVEAGAKLTATIQPRSGGSTQSIAQAPSTAQVLNGRSTLNETTSQLKANAGKTIPVPQISALLPKHSLSAQTCRTNQLGSHRVQVDVGNVSSAHDVGLQQPPSSTSLNATPSKPGKTVEQTVDAERAANFVITDKTNGHHGQKQLLPPAVVPVNPLVANKSHAIPLTLSRVADKTKPDGDKCLSVHEESCGIENESMTAKQPPWSKQSQKRNKTVSDPTKSIHKPKTKTARSRSQRVPKEKKKAKSAKLPNRNPIADLQDKPTAAKDQKSRKRKGKGTTKAENKTKQRRRNKAMAVSYTEKTGEVKGVSNGGTGGDNRCTTTPVVRSAFLESESRSLPPPCKNDKLYRLRGAGVDNAASAIDVMRLPALNFGGVGGKVRLPPIPQALLEGNCKERVEIDYGMAPNDKCAIGVDRSKEDSKIMRTEPNTTMTEKGGRVHAPAHETKEGDEGNVERNECTSCVDRGNGEMRRLRKEVQMLRALLLWKESGFSGGRTVSPTIDETKELARASTARVVERSGNIERTLRGVRVVRLGELLSRLDVRDVATKMDGLTKHVLHMGKERMYEHCVYEGMQFIGYEMSLSGACDRSVGSVVKVFDMVKQSVVQLWRCDTRDTQDGCKSGFTEIISYVSGEIRRWLSKMAREGWTCLSWSEAICSKMGGELSRSLEAEGCARGSDALHTALRAALRDSNELLEAVVAETTETTEAETKVRGRCARFCRAVETGVCIAACLQDAAQVVCTRDMRTIASYAPKYLGCARHV